MTKALNKQAITTPLKAMRFAIQAHEDTNHKYDGYAYSVHLAHVVSIANRFYPTILSSPEEWVSIVSACWLHDTIEDARQSYNDIKKEFGTEIADIVRAVTNYGRGRNRNERMPEFVYDEIRQTKNATFVKLCDRIANMEYSMMNTSKNSMFQKYAQESVKFKSKLFEEKYDVMFHYMDMLIESYSQDLTLRS